MDRLPRRGIGRWVGLVLLLAFLGLGGCENIWNWTVDDDSFDALLSDGRRAIREAHYGVAVDKLSRAVEIRPENSDARYYLAKAVILRADVDVYELVRSLTEDGSESGAVEIFAFDVPHANSIYGANRLVLGNLEPIRRGFATEGSFTAEHVDLDLSVAYLLCAILRLRDTNGDGVIDASDVSLLELIDAGDGFSLEGLNDLTPEQVNALLADVAALLVEGGDLLAGALGDSGVDVEGLQDVTSALQTDMSLYYVNNGLPGNPGIGDNDADGATDEECFNGLDDDGDGRTDEDSRTAGC
jgi:hypothetical protein